jgi:hypothetical protein
VQVIVVEEGLMWMPASVEGEEVAWVVVLWPVEGLLKWDFSTPVAITSLEEEEPPIVVLADTMVEKYTAWKG